MRIALGAIMVLFTGCIDPLVSDEVARTGLILPNSAVVEDLLTSDPAWRATLTANDGLPDDTSEVRLLTAFSGGRSIRFWDFGPVSPTPIPLYLLVAESDTPRFETPRGDFAPVGHHPPIFDAIPGDPGYSPLWSVVLVPVTDRYAGELLPSFAAVEEAHRLGLVGAPIPIDIAINSPVVLPEARLERRDGSFSTPKSAFYKGFVVHYFDFDTITFDAAGGQLAVSTVYELRRSGGEPISEPIRGVDFTGDGALRDTNDLFVAAPGDAAYTGLVKPVDTIVSAELETLDRTPIPGTSALTSASDLFRDGVPDPAVVVALYPRAVVFNRPIAPSPEP